jgi:hypothetical protein
MSRFHSSTWKAAIRRGSISAYYRHKAEAELIPENENVFRPKIRPDAVVTIKLKDQPQMQFSTYKLPNGEWTISPTLAGKKVQQVLLRA